MNNPVYLGLSILDLHETVLYGFSYDYVEPEFGENNKLCYMDTNSFIVHVKTDDIYKDIAKDVETRFDTTNFEKDRPLPKGKNEKVVGLMNMKKAKGTKKWIIKVDLIKFPQKQVKLKIEQTIYKKNKTQIDIIKKDKKEFLKNNKRIIKIHDLKVKDVMFLLKFKQICFKFK